jgi:hypothetical protein
LIEKGFDVGESKLTKIVSLIKERALCIRILGNEVISFFCETTVMTKKQVKTGNLKLLH